MPANGQLKINFCGTVFFLTVSMDRFQGTENVPKSLPYPRMFAPSHVWRDLVEQIMMGQLQNHAHCLLAGMILSAMAQIPKTQMESLKHCVKQRNPIDFLCVQFGKNVRLVGHLVLHAPFNPTHIHHFYCNTKFVSISAALLHDVQNLQNTS